MPRQRQENLLETKDWLSRLELSIDADRTLRHQDSHIELEGFFCAILNLIFGWKLKNANALGGGNQDSFDLVDQENRIAAQVTVTTAAKKIRKTLGTFVGVHDRAYGRLVFVYPRIKIAACRADFSGQLDGYDFDPVRDRLCLGDVLKWAQGASLEEQRQLLQILREELAPLGDTIGRRRIGLSLLKTKFKPLIEACSAIDRGLLPIIRGKTFAPKRLVDDEYRDLLDVRMSRAGIDFEKLVDVCTNPETRDGFIGSVPKEDVVIDIGPDLRRVTFGCSVGELPVENPELVFDCWCYMGAEGSPGCPIHGRHRTEHEKVTGEALETRMMTGLICTRYDGLEFLWRRGPEMWPPAIDSILMLEDLRRSNSLSGAIGSVLDVGCGTGFLGTTIGNSNTRVHTIAFCDWLATPLAYSIINWFRSEAQCRSVRVQALPELVTAKRPVLEQPYDLVVCNPPYIPVLSGYEENVIDHTVIGTELLCQVIARAGELGKRVYVQFSKMALPEAREAERSGGVRLEPIGPEREVPFRPRHMIGKEDYCAELAKRKRILEGRGNHRYSHYIRTYKVVF